EGARDLLRRGLVRVLGAAVDGTPPGGGVTARAQILPGGRARIDIQDECGGGGVVPAGHCIRPGLALAPQRSSADWSIVRGAVAANRGTVHARKLPGVGCLVTIDLPGQGDEEPCCDETAATTTGR
ncbi:MAG TPA: ATP-binding protein, partial [Polyangia bacterium]